MDTIVLIATLVGVFVVLPVGIGIAVGHRFAACVIWLGLVGLMAFSQSRDDSGLAGIWIVVAVFGVGEVPLVLAGAGLRARMSRCRRRGTQAEVTGDPEWRDSPEKVR